MQAGAEPLVPQSHQHGRFAPWAPHSPGSSYLHPSSRPSHHQPGMWQLLPRLCRALLLCQAPSAAGWRERWGPSVVGHKRDCPAVAQRERALGHRGTDWFARAPGPRRTRLCPGLGVRWSVATGLASADGAAGPRVWHLLSRHQARGEGCAAHPIHLGVLVWPCDRGCSGARCLLSLPPRGASSTCPCP